MQQTLTTFSTLFQAWRNGDKEAEDEMIRLVYHHLHLLASAYLKRESATPSIQATELINETWLRLFGHEQPDFDNRAHFFVIAARQMRRILIDRAREANSGRRIPKKLLIPIDDANEMALPVSDYLLTLDESLQKLEESMPRAGQVVELRYFAGLTEEQAAQILGVSITTIKRDWAFAKLWLLEKITDGHAANKDELKV